MNECLKKKIVDLLEYDELCPDEQFIWDVIGEDSFKLLKLKYEGLGFHLAQIRSHKGKMQLIILQELEKSKFHKDPFTHIKCTCDLYPGQVKRIIGPENYAKFKRARVTGDTETLFNIEL